MLTKQQLKQNLLSRPTTKNKLRNPQTVNYERTKQQLTKQLLSFQQPFIKVHSQPQKINTLNSFFKRVTIEARPRDQQKAINYRSAQTECQPAQSRLYIGKYFGKQEQEQMQQRIYLNEYFMKQNKKQAQIPQTVAEKENLQETALQIENTINLCFKATNNETMPDYRAVSKIQDEIKFKREIEEEKQRKKQQVLAQSIKKRQRTEKISIFNGCAAKVFSSPQNTTNYETKIIQVDESKDISQVEEITQKQKEEKFNFFDFLKGKISSLTQKDNQKTQKQDRNQKIQEVEAIPVKNTIQTTKLNNPNENLNDVSMKPELSQSDSGSFFRQKQRIQQKGILNVDLRNIVDSSVKQVEANIQKIQENIRKIDSEKSKINDKTRKISEIQKSNQSYTKTIQIPVVQSQKKNVSQIKEIQQSKIKKIFGESKKSIQQKVIQKKEIPQNHSELKQISEFFAAQNVIPNKMENISQPSTVQKNDERSIECSDFFNNLNFEQKDNEIVGNLFQKNEEGSKNIKEDEVNLQKVLSELQGQKQVQKSEKQQPQKSYQLSISKLQTVNKNRRQININLMDLQQVSLSFDAFSFSKLSNLTERQELNQPTLNSFKAMSNAKQPLKQLQLKIDQKKQKQTNNKANNAQQQLNSMNKRGNVQKIQINLDSDQSDEDASKQDQDSQIDLDDIKDYDSGEDEDEQAENHKQNLNTKGKSRVNLTPIMQQDLEESQLFRKKTNFKKNSNQMLLQPQQSAKEQNIKHHQQSLPTDFKMTKIKSEEINNLKPDKEQSIQSKPKVIKLVKPPIKKVSLIKNLSQPENSSISNLSMTSEKDLNKTEKQLIQSIKGDIEGLKQKISSICMSQSEKSASKINNKSNLHSDVKQISIDLDSFSQSFKKQGSKQEEYNTLEKLMKEKSMCKNRSSMDKKPSERQTKQNINFDQLDASVQQGLYKQFKQNFMSLKERVENDHKLF